MGRPKKVVDKLASSVKANGALKELEGLLQLKLQNQIKQGMSKLFDLMELPRASAGVLKVKTKKQFKLFTSIARGWFKWVGGVGSDITEQAVALLDKIEEHFEEI